LEDWEVAGWGSAWAVVEVVLAEERGGGKGLLETIAPVEDEDWRRVVVLG
jgi:hypothetical protein